MLTVIKKSKWAFYIMGFALILIPGYEIAAKEPLKPVRIYIAGDSTASHYARNLAPRTGWGQVLQEYFNDAVTVKNYAASGRSSKSYIAELQLKRIEMEIQPGDYLLVQFGHNDEKKDDPDRYTEPFTTFKENLKIFIESGKKLKFHVVLVTPINRRSFDAEGKIRNTHTDYPAAMIELGKEMNIPVIDMTALSKDLFEKAGPEEAKKYFLYGKKDELKWYPKGVADDTHFSEYGAKTLAGIIAKELGTHVPTLKEYLK
ncbi:MAG: rhamnogalacturonan acetylesterase [Spirochaetales bacterium]|nr:rhamnogalacturonan acetylesterase [Spirochaetales bacterium]